jgi:colanic acid/amylovoran biosynthesis protein
MYLNVMHLHGLKSLARKFEYSIRASNWFFQLISFLFIFLPKGFEKDSTNFLLPHPGNGNIGDQAMLDSFLNFLGRECILVVEDKSRFKEVNQLGEEIEIVEIPDLIYGNFFRSLIAIFYFFRVSNRIKTFSMIGADVMDGHYNYRASINRLVLLRFVGILNIDSRVTGFSWSENAKPLTLKLLKHVSSSTRLYVRDPASARRLRESGITSISEVSDLVFHDETRASFPDVERWVSTSEKPIVLINISGLGLTDHKSIANHINQYTYIVNSLRSHGYRILITPHVFRKIDGDLEVSNLLFSEACTSEDFLIQEPFTPAQERHLVNHVSFVVTGRMHVAVIALASGTPAIAIETMGKVKGLFELFDLSDYCVEQDANFGTIVVERIELLESHYLRVCDLINASLSEVRRKSAINFTGLPRAEEPR